MITELYINVVLKPYTPLEVIKTLHAVCNSEVEELEDKPPTWVHMFDGSAAKRNNKWCTLTYWSELNKHHLVGIGSTEESVDDIISFFDYIKPWSENDFIGYYRHDCNREPTLIYGSVYPCPYSEMYYEPPH